MTPEWVHPGFVLIAGAWLVPLLKGRVKRIAMILRVSIKTVETHRASAMRKLSLRTTADLVRYAVRNQLIQA